MLRSHDKLLHSYSRLGEKVKSKAKKCVFRTIRGGAGAFGHLVFGTHSGGFATKALSPRGPLRGDEERKLERKRFRGLIAPQGQAPQEQADPAVSILF